MANRNGSFGFLLTLLTLGPLATAALAGPTARVRSIPAEVVSPFAEGKMHGVVFRVDKAAAREAGANLTVLSNLLLYDNLPTFLGGTAAPGVFGPGSAAGTFAFVDWNLPSIAWGDDLHGVADGPFGGLLTNLRYAYRNAVAPSTHIIKIYEMVPPSAAHATYFTSQKGPLVTQLTLPVMPPAPTGINLTTVPGLNVPLPPGNAFWIEFHESGPGYPNTFWLTGGLPGVGSSHDGVTYTYTGPFYPPPGYNLFYAAPYLYFLDPPRYVGANVAVALHGPQGLFHDDFESGGVCPWSNPTCNTCGNSVLEAGEECDDGNTSDDDGCSSSCLIEFCGDGITQASEWCDDGNTSDDDGCSSTCMIDSCVGYCNVNPPPYPADADCYCDDLCVDFGDCCYDACAVCGKCYPTLSAPRSEPSRGAQDNLFR